MRSRLIQTITRVDPVVFYLQCLSKYNRWAVYVNYKYILDNRDKRLSKKDVDKDHEKFLGVFKKYGVKFNAFDTYKPGEAVVVEFTSYKLATDFMNAFRNNRDSVYASTFCHKREFKRMWPHHMKEKYVIESFSVADWVLSDTNT